MPAPVPQAAPSGRSGPARRGARANRVAALGAGLVAVSALVVIAAVAMAAIGARRGGVSEGATQTPPARLSGLRLVGRDDKGRPFELIAVSATRDPQAVHRIALERPVLVMEEAGEAATRVVAATGLYDEQTGALALSGGVDYSGTQGVFRTSTALVDTRTGQVAGSSAIRAQTSVGEVEGESYEVTKKGENVVLKGGVRGRLAPN